MRPTVRFFVSAWVVALWFAACGSRTALLVSSRSSSSPADAAGPLYEGGRLDARIDCDAPAYCDPRDDSKLFQCGVAVYQCSSLEQCRPVPDVGAACVNPCADTLGSDTSNGCEFYAAPIDTTDEVSGVCFAVFVVNQWGTGEPARLEVSRMGNDLPLQEFARIPTGTGTSIRYAPYNPATGLPKDQVAILFLSRDPEGLTDPEPTAPRRLAGCPPGVIPAFVGDSATHGTGRGQAFRIRSNVPIVAYQMLPYGAGRARVTSATLLLPTSAWGTNYVAVNAAREPTLFSVPRAGPTLMIVGQENNTTVTVRPTQPILPGGGAVGDCGEHPRFVPRRPGRISPVHPAG